MDFNDFRDLFPVTQNWTYLNNAAVAPISTRVSDAVAQFMALYADAGNTLGKQWAAQTEEIRALVARILNASPEEIAFVRNTSHGLSLVARGLEWKKGDVVIVPAEEYPANVYPWMSLKKQGVELRRIPMNGPGFYADDFKAALTPEVRLVSLSSGEYLNGFRNDLDSVIKLAHANGSLVCVDFIQTFGAFGLDVKKSPFDFGAADAHKWMLGPEGIGVFYCKKEHIPNLDPALVGWNNVINPLIFHEIDYTLKPDATRFEEGSLPVMTFIALEAALKLLEEVGIDRIGKRILDLQDIAIEAGKKRGWEFFSPIEDRAHRGLALSFKIPNVDTTALVPELFAKKIYCADRAGWIRISPHAYNNEKDIETFLAALPDA